MTYPVARILGKETFGAFGMIQQTLMTFSMFGASALGLAANKFLAELRDKDKERSSRIVHFSTALTFAIAILVALVFIIFAEPISISLFKKDIFASAVRLGGLSLILISLSGTQTGILAGFNSFKTISFLNMTRGFLTILLVTLGAKQGGLFGALLGLTICSLVVVVLGTLEIKKLCKNYELSAFSMDCFSEWRLAFTFILPALLTSMAYLVTTWYSNVLILQSPQGLAESAYLNISLNWRNAILLVPSFFTSPLLSALSAVELPKESGKFRKLIGFGIGIQTLAALLPSLFVVLISHRILSGYGSSYVAQIPTLQLMCLASVLAAPTMVLVQAITSRGYQWDNCFLHAVWALVMMGCCRFVFSISAHGVSMAFVAAYFVQLILFTGYSFFRFRGQVAPAA